MRLTYYGHSAFMLTSNDNVNVLMDPYQPGGYGGAIAFEPIPEHVDIVTISHEHDDHNAIQSLISYPLVIRCSSSARGLKFTVWDTWHDACQGTERGPNRIMKVEIDGVSVLHCGDLGHELDDILVPQLGAVNVLLIPVGGRFTLNAEQASRLTDLLAPAIVIPMHYKSQYCHLPIATVADFAQIRQRVRRLLDPSIELEAGKLPEPTETLILEPVN